MNMDDANRRLTSLEDVVEAMTKAVTQVGDRVRAIEEDEVPDSPYDFDRRNRVLQRITALENGSRLVGTGNLIENIMTRLDGLENGIASLSDQGNADRNGLNRVTAATAENHNRLNETEDRVTEVARRLMKGDELIEKWTDRQLDKIVLAIRDYDRRCGQLDQRIKGWMVVAERADQRSERLEAEMERMSENFTKRIDALESRLDGASIKDNPFGWTKDEFSPPVGGKAFADELATIHRRVTGIQAMKRETYERGFSAGQTAMLQAVEAAVVDTLRKEEFEESTIAEVIDAIRQAR